MHDDADLLLHLRAVCDLVDRAPQRDRIVCGTSPRVADGDLPTSLTLTFRATTASRLFLTLDEYAHRVSMTEGDSYVELVRRWGAVHEGTSAGLSRGVATWLLAHGTLFRATRLDVCEPCIVEYAIMENGLLRLVSRERLAAPMPTDPQDEWQRHRRVRRTSTSQGLPPSLTPEHFP